MKIDIETMLKENIKQIVSNEVDEMIKEKGKEIYRELMSKRDVYIAELMKSIRIVSEQQITDNNIPKYLITIENTYKIEK